jgi:hypothetical protein
MTTDRERLTTFFYLLSRGDLTGLGWGEINALIDECRSSTLDIFTSSGGETLAREMVDRLLGPAAEPVPEPVLDAGWQEFPPELLGAIKRWRNENLGALRDVERAYQIGLAVGENDARATGNPMGHLNADAIIAYDLERDEPASADVHFCIRQIADKVHYAPVHIAGLVADERAKYERAVSALDAELEAECSRHRATLAELEKARASLLDSPDMRRHKTLREAGDFISSARSCLDPGLYADGLIERCYLAAIADGGVVHSKPDSIGARLVAELAAVESEIADLRTKQAAGQYNDKAIRHGLEEATRLRDVLRRVDGRESAYASAVPNNVGPRAVLAAAGWQDLGEGLWGLACTSVVVHAADGSCSVNGGEEIGTAAMRALADIADGSKP